MNLEQKLDFLHDKQARSTQRLQRIEAYNQEYNSWAHSIGTAVLEIVKHTLEGHVPVNSRRYELLKRWIGMDGSSTATGNLSAFLTDEPEKGAFWLSLVKKGLVASITYVIRRDVKHTFDWDSNVRLYESCSHKPSTIFLRNVKITIHTIQAFDTQISWKDNVI